MSLKPTTDIAVQAEQSAALLGHRTGPLIRLVNRAASPSAASTANRRRADRVSPADTQFSDSGRLRPGHSMRVIDISERGILIESPIRLPIGGRVEICLTEANTDARLVLSGIARRCEVKKLSPLTYTGALEFDEGIELQVLQPYVESSTRTA